MDFKEQYFNVWKTIWEFHRKWFSNDDSDETWKKILDESSVIVKQYEDKPEKNFAKNLMVAVLSEIERTCRAKRGGKSIDGTNE